ncbi:MAG: DegT/DnrJ/EryC1/StrS aminotransferase [Candidatus Cloacimonadota bacterium]|nr:MAG: DegT/DnrJ/EryC1/StrS aminotransferase [Candidatus Cloacimonadota bacterium]
MKSAFYKEHETRLKLSEFILKADQLSMSEQCYQFEEKFAEFCKSKYAILFNSGGSANLALLQALKNQGLLRSGSKIAFSALTWSTNVMPIIQLGMEPVPVDVDPNSLNIMSENVKELIENNEIDALFTTNVLGFAGDLDKIKELCTNNNVIFLEDNCEALGTELQGRKTGTFGLAGTHSFFVAHHMSTIEGGMICTDDEDLADMLKIVRANGWDRNLSAKKQISLRKRYDVNSEFQAKYTFYDLGYNFRPTEITGFLGLVQLEYLKENIIMREKNHNFLELSVLNNEDLVQIEHNHLNVVSGFAFPVIAKTSALRDKYFAQFSGAGVEIRPIISGNMEKQPFFKKYVTKAYSLPVADKIHDCGFYFGNYPELNTSDLNILSNCLTKY